MSPDPIQDGHDAATDDQKIAGIVEQMRADLSQGNVADVRDVLTQRFGDAEIELSDAQFERITAELIA